MLSLSIHSISLEPHHEKTRFVFQCENKGTDQLCSNYTAGQCHCFCFRFFFLNPKFQASSRFLLLHRSICVRPGRKPGIWFSHVHLYQNNSLGMVSKVDITRGLEFYGTNFSP